MNRIILILIITLASFNASAFTLGPLEITLTSGPNVNVSFTNQFRGLLNNISDVVQNNSVVKFIKYALNYGSTSENINLVPGKNNLNFPAPPGWPNANTPPATTNINYCTPWAPVICAYPLSASCAQYQNSNNTVTAYNTQQCKIVRNSDGYTEYVSQTLQCPTGYSQSGTTCNLTNASLVKWPSDGKPTIYQDSTGNLKLHPMDPDLPSATGAGGSFAGGGASGTWRVPATDQHANPVQVDHTTTSDGGMDVSRKLETVSPETGKTTVYEEIIHYNDQGAITNHYNNEYPNTTINDINEGGGTTPPAGKIEIDIPDITVSGNGGAIPAFNRGNTPTANQSLTDFKNYLNNHPIIKPLRDATFSPSGQACPMQLSVAMAPFGYPMNLSTDIMCQITEIMRPVISTVTTVAWTWLALTVILAA